MTRNRNVLLLVARRPLFLIVTVLSVALLFVTNFAVHASSPAPLVVIPNSIAPHVAGAHMVGHHNTADQLTIGLVLKTSHAAEQQNLLKSLYNPLSSTYHHWLQNGEFDARFAPAASQVTAAKDYLTSAGLNVLSSSPSATLLLAQGTAGQIESAFHTRLNDFNASNGESFFANTTNVQIPQTLSGSVLGVAGLTNHVAQHSYATPPTPDAAGAPPAYGGGPFGSGLTPSQIAGIYNATPVYNTLKNKGQGISLAVFELSGYLRKDITAYENQYKLPHVPLIDKLVQGGPVPITAGGSPDYGAAEVELDIELQIALAPGIKHLLVYNAPNSELGVISEYLQIAKDNVADATSSSWGSCEYLSTSSAKLAEFQAFTQMATQGQSIFSAAGDNGAYDCLPYTDANLTGSNQLQVDDPSSQPYVTAVGGTAFNNSKKQVLFDPGKNPHPAYPGTSKELTWTRGCMPTDCEGGGGGVSRYWGSIDYQSGGGRAVPGFIETGLTQSGAYCNQTAGVFCRELPDVSLDADPITGYSVYCTDPGDSFCKTGEFGKPGWIRLGGTSCASPLWAAITALIDHQAKGRQGLLNYYLYNFDSPAGYASQFHDITLQDNGHYPAGATYDIATGLGTPNILRLVKP